MMGRLNETIERCISAIDRKREAQDSQVSEVEYKKALLLLARASSDLQDTLNTAERIVTRGVSDWPVVSSAMRDGLLEYIGDCERQLDDQMLTKETVKLLQTKIDAAKERIAYEWSRCAERYVKGTSKYLSTISNVFGDPERAMRLSESILSLMKGAPSMGNVDRLVDEMAEAESIIEVYPISPEIEAFLEKVASSSALVSDLTPDVEIWLKDNDLTSKLRIVF